MAKDKKTTARVLPTINKPVETQSNEPKALNDALTSIRRTLHQAVTGKRNFDKGFAYTTANLWTLFQVGHFDYDVDTTHDHGLKQLVLMLHNGAEQKASALEFFFNRTGMYKEIPDMIEPEKVSKKGTPEDVWKAYQDKKRLWQKTFSPLANITARAIVAVAFLADPKRKLQVGVISSGNHKGCLYLAGPIYGNEGQHMPHNIVPYDKACATLEEHARNSFALKRRQATASDAGVSIKRASEIMVEAIKKEPGSIKAQPPLVAMMRSVKEGIEAMTTPFASTVPGFKEALRDLIYTLLSEQQGIIAHEVANAAMKQAENWQPPKDDSKQLNIVDAVGDTQHTTDSGVDATA